MVAPRKWLQGMVWLPLVIKIERVSLPRTFGHQQRLPRIKIEGAEHLGINSIGEPPIDSETDGGKTSWRAAGGVYTRVWFTL